MDKYKYRDSFRIPSRVKTKDGNGTLIARKLIKGSNNGPGCHKFIVLLDNGNKRVYSRKTVEKI